MKKILLLLLCFCATLGISKAQSISSSVVGSSGGDFASANGSLEWTLGEIMTETFASNRGFFTQGFHQPSIVRITDLVEETTEEIKAYPNPFSDRLFIKAPAGTYTTHLTDLHGRTIFSADLEFKNSEHHTIETTSASQAIYILRLINNQTSQVYHIKLQKN